MRTTLFYSLVIAVGVATGLALAVTSAVAKPGEPHHAEHDTVDDPRDSDLKALLAQIEETGLLPVGVNATGDGPFGYVEADKAVVVDGKAPAELQVVDADGRHIGWLIHGLAPMSIEDYLADPAGHRAEGEARVATLTAAVSPQSPSD